MHFDFGMAASISKDNLSFNTAHDHRTLGIMCLSKRLNTFKTLFFFNKLQLLKYIWHLPIKLLYFMVLTNQINKS